MSSVFRLTQHSARRLGRRQWTAVVLLAASIATLGCSPSSLIDVQSPSTVVDPSQIKTAASAAQLRTGALVRMIGALGRYPETSVIMMSGFLTDEMSETYYTSGGYANDRNVLNTSLGKNTAGYDYGQIQVARVKAQQARQALQLYAANTPGVPRAWQGEMYALEGYAIIWLAELYCSGIPLTSAPLTGAQIPTRGFTTEEMFTAAIALFDSAAVAGADSAQYVNLALVGKARALLDLGRFAEADSAVQNVPTNFVYLLQSSVSSTEPYSIFQLPMEVTYMNLRVEDHEGGNGLVWSTDPRTGVVTVPSLTGDMLWPGKYNADSATGVVDPTIPRRGISARLADGLEARLIQAEASLAAGRSDWLTTLNTLRATCVALAPCAPIAGLTAASLPALSDPGTPAARLDTLMKERAMWLYLTGHREGDLRRMAHVYGRDPETLWPTGYISIPAYLPSFSQPGSEDHTLYGSDVVFGPDANEQILNPLYGGCYDTNP